MKEKLKSINNSLKNYLQDNSPIEAGTLVEGIDVLELENHTCKLIGSFVSNLTSVDRPPESRRLNFYDAS